MVAETERETETKVHQNFLSQPMRDRPVKDLPGIGNVISQSMNAAGIYRAKYLYGVFLKDGPDALRDFVKSHGANQRNSQQALNAIKEWDQQHN